MDGDDRQIGRLLNRREVLALMRNEGDGIFRDGGDRLMLEPVVAAEGWASEFRLGLEI